MMTGRPYHRPMFSVRVCLAAVYPEKMGALPTSYNVLVPICWLLVLHVLLPLCLLAKDHVHEGISALARAKIQGRADLDEDMCFRDPKMQEKLWRHGQASRESQELAGVAVQLFGMFKLAKDCGGVTPGGAFDPISAQEVRNCFRVLMCMAWMMRHVCSHLYHMIGVALEQKLDRILVANSSTAPDRCQLFPAHAQ